MAEPDPPADMGATRLRPSEWAAPASSIPEEGAQASASARRRGVWAVLPWLLLLALVGAAIVLAPAGGLRLPGTRPLAEAPAPAIVAPVPDPAVEELRTRLAALEAARAEPPVALAGVEGTSPQLVQRIATLEAELRRLAESGRMTEARIDALINDLDSAGATSGAAAASTARARDFFILLGVRRQLERGRPLGALEPALRQQFDAREPAATAALAAWSRAPVAQALLAEQLATIGASPAPGTEGETSAPGFLARIWQGLRGVVEVRRPEDEGIRLSRERAQSALARGDLASAIAIMEAGPAGTVPGDWLADARRLSAAQEGIERLELIALQDVSASAPVGAASQP